MTSRTYTQKWRDKIRPGVQSAAAALVPLLHDLFHPSSVIDVGCGEGWFLREFETLGATTVGVDGSWVDGARHVDLTAPPYPELERSDLALCLEVAEHVDAKHADDLVAWLVSLASVVVFSAAIPGQGGTGHVNEQWPDYWVDKFAAHNYEGTGELRAHIWNDERIEPWYRQNLLIFASAEADRFNAEGGLWNDGCPSIVHPGIWKCYR